MNNLEILFHHIKFDYVLLHNSIKSLFGENSEEFITLLDDISQEENRQAAKSLVLKSSDLRSRGAALRILAAIKRWEEENLHNSAAGR